MMNLNNNSKKVSFVFSFFIYFRWVVTGEFFDQ